MIAAGATAFSKKKLLAIGGGIVGLGGTYEAYCYAHKKYMADELEADAYAIDRMKELGMDYRQSAKAFVEFMALNDHSNDVEPTCNESIIKVVSELHSIADQSPHPSVKNRSLQIEKLLNSHE